MKYFKYPYGILMLIPMFLIICIAHDFILIEQIMLPATLFGGIYAIGLLLSGVVHIFFYKKLDHTAFVILLFKVVYFCTILITFYFSISLLITVFGINVRSYLGDCFLFLSKFLLVSHLFVAFVGSVYLLKD